MSDDAKAVTCVSSDTNVWIDFDVVGRIDLPFLLPYRYLMWHEAVRDEFLAPGCLGERLSSLGLESVDIDEREFFLADRLGQKYPGLSAYDCVALAIASVRGIVLVTGDKRLRSAAANEGVHVMGSIALLDEMLERGLVAREEYRKVIAGWVKKNGSVVRMPSAELLSRL